MEGDSLELTGAGAQEQVDDAAVLAGSGSVFVGGFTVREETVPTGESVLVNPGFKAVATRVEPVVS